MDDICAREDSYWAQAQSFVAEKLKAKKLNWKHRSIGFTLKATGKVKIRKEKADAIQLENSIGPKPNYIYFGKRREAALELLREPRSLGNKRERTQIK